MSDEIKSFDDWRINVPAMSSPKRDKDHHALFFAEKAFAAGYEAGERGMREKAAKVAAEKNADRYAARHRPYTTDESTWARFEFAERQVNDVEQAVRSLPLTEGK